MLFTVEDISVVHTMKRNVALLNEMYPKYIVDMVVVRNHTVLRSVSVYVHVDVHVCACKWTCLCMYVPVYKPMQSMEKS